MSDINDHLQSAIKRFGDSGDWQGFVTDVFAVRWKCSILPREWQKMVPELVETGFRPLIEGCKDAGGKTVRMVVLGDVLRLNGFQLEAEKWLRRAAEVAEQADDPHTRRDAFRRYANLLHQMGRHTEAARYLKRMMEAGEHLDPIQQGYARVYDTAELSETGQHADTVESAKSLADFAQRVGGPFDQFSADICCGMLLGKIGQNVEAAKYLKRAAAAAERFRDDPRRQCDIYLRCSEQMGKIGQNVEATRYLKRAAKIAEELDDPITNRRVFLDYGRLLSRTGQQAEADRYLKRATEAAEQFDDPVSRCITAFTSACFHESRHQFETALAEYGAAQRYLHEMLTPNRYPQAIGNILGSYSGIFDLGLLMAQRVFLESKHAQVLFHGVAFADGLKAVSVREGLRRHSSRRFHPQSDNWSAGPDDWKKLFGEFSSDIPHTAGVASRSVALRTARAVVPVPERTPTILELPEEEDETKAELSLPVGEAELQDALPNSGTVALVFHFLDDDLYILPVRRGADGTPAVIHTEEGYFWVSKVRPAFDKLLEAQAGALTVIQDAEWFKDGAAPLREKLQAEGEAGGFDLMEVPFELNKLFRLDELLPLIEPDAAKWAKLHLMLLPDGPLYQLPLHTAAVTIGEKSFHLIDVVGSVRYSLSLRTLHTLGKVETEQAAAWPDGVPLRGTAFVNPASEPPQGLEGYPPLAFAPKEVENLIGNSSPKSWRIFGECSESADWLATRANMRQYHPTPTLLWSVCHGGLMPDTFTPRGFDKDVTVVNPSLLLADGPLSTARMVSEGYDLRGVHLWHNSCCLLGRLESADGHRQVEGYIAALTLLGCRRVTSAMWELADHSAAQFAKHFLLRLRANVFEKPNRSPQAVAISLKEAMADFRKHNDGEFDHPYYWAPYTLYGLG